MTTEPAAERRPAPSGGSRDGRPAPRVSTPAVVVALARRGLLPIIRIPAAVVPTVLMPVFFVVSFSGSYRAITGLPGFPTDNILNWFVPFAVIQGASFAGMGVAFATARDVESGFYDRLLLAPIPRVALVLASMGSAAVRGLLSLCTVLPIGLLAGARVPGGAAGLAVLACTAVTVAMLGALWALGVVYRLRSQRGIGLVQVGIFGALFLSIGQVPLEVMEGWLHTVARINPATNVLRLARQGFLGDVTWSATWPGLVALAVVGAGLAVFAATGYRRLQP